MALKIEIYRMVHEGRTKEYDIIRITNGTMYRAATRWSKVGKSGQMNWGEQSAGIGVVECEHKRLAKQKRGYNHQDTLLVDSVEELRRHERSKFGNAIRHPDFMRSITAFANIRDDVEARHPDAMSALRVEDAPLPEGWGEF